MADIYWHIYASLGLNELNISEMNTKVNLAAW